MVLLDLDNTEFVLTAFSLHWNNILSTSPVYSQIQLIGLHLSHALHIRPQMVLERVTSQAQEYIDQAVISKFRQKSLFIS
jgi:hypothetical protein